MADISNWSPIKAPAKIYIVYPIDRLRLVNGQFIHPDGTSAEAYLKKCPFDPDESVTIVNTAYLQYLEDRCKQTDFIGAA